MEKYYCTDCKRYHIYGEIYNKHLKYKKVSQTLKEIRNENYIILNELRHTKIMIDLVKQGKIYDEYVKRLIKIEEKQKEKQKKLEK